MYIVNGKKVGYLDIHKDPNGDTIVNYDEKFNLVKVHMGVIMKKLHDNGINHVHVSKDLKHRIICPDNTEITVKCIYNNGEWSYTANGNIITFSANYTPLKITTIENNRGSSYMKDLIIKAL